MTKRRAVVVSTRDAAPRGKGRQPHQPTKAGQKESRPGDKDGNPEKQQDSASLADLIDPVAEVRYRRTLARETYRDGYADGWEAGRRALLEDQAARARLECDYLAQLARRPDHAELERRRWTVRGEQRDRATFADPHPDDYQGAA